MVIPKGYRIVETDERVPVAPLSTHWFKGRAERSAARFNEERLAPTWVARPVREGRRWLVVGFQNRLERVSVPRRPEPDPMGPPAFGGMA